MRKRSRLSVLASVTRKFSYVLLVLALLLVILVIAQKVINPFKVVASNSMSPQIKEGDAIILKEVKPGNLKPGDVVVFRDPGIRDQLVIHRVVEVNKGKYSTVLTTKGDNNPVGDVSKVTTGQVVGGVALNIPRFGSFLDFMSEPRGYIACIAIPGAVALALVFLLGVGETAEKKKPV
jgi:signal peptidase I